MSESMRKIIFYENILEFKENRKDQLTLNEVNNWEICRTCLVKTDVDDVDVEKMCVMDAIEGTFFNIKEMLKAIGNVKVSIEENIATKVCKTCFNKITNLYYFMLQVRKAEQILKRMVNNFKDDKKSLTVIKKKDREEVKGEKFHVGNTDQNIIIEVEELFGYTPDMENAMEIDASIIEDNENANGFEKEEEEIRNFDEKKEESTESKGGFDSVDELFQEIYDDITSEANNDNKSEKCENKEKLKSESEFKEYENTNEEIEDTFSCADSFEELYITDAEHFELDSSQTKDKCLGSDTDEMPLKFKTQLNRSVRPKSKHVQPRIDMPLLEDLKCRICKQTFDRQSELVDHTYEKHPNTKAFKCRFCSSAFAHIQSLSRHVRKHKSYLVKYTCHFCYREFLRADDLKRHIRTHTGERPYQCSFCEKSFKQQGEMKSHEETHLPKKTYYCTQCPKTFGSRNGLYLHRRRHHIKFFVGRKKRVVKNDKPKEREKVVQFSSDEGE